MRQHRLTTRVSLLTLASLGSLVVAGPAWGHVTVHGDQAAPGETAQVVFRVPNESGDRATTQVQVHLLPEGAPPIASASTTPVPGWRVEVEYEELAEPVADPHGVAVVEAVSVITWTAEDGASALGPGEYLDFPVILGPLPDADELYFPTLQWFEGVEEPVRWISPPEPGGGEPPDPAPVLLLSGPGEQPAGEPEPDPEVAGEGEPGAGTAAEPDRTGVWLGTAGLVAGLAALALAGFAVSRTRR